VKVSNRQTSYSVFFAIVVLASPCLLLATFLSQRIQYCMR